MSDLFDTGLNWLNEGASFVKSAADTVASFKQAQLSYYIGQQSQDLARTQAKNAVDLAKLQAAATLKASQQVVEKPPVAMPAGMSQQTVLLIAAAGLLVVLLVVVKRR